MNPPPDDVPADPLMPARLSLGIAVSMVALGSLLGIVVRGDRHMPGDIAILRAIQRVDLPGVDALVTFSNLAFSTGGAIVLAVLFLAVARLRDRPGLIRQLGIVIAIRLAFEVWKPAFGSPRPGVEYQPDPSLVSSTLGYPSGHAQTAAVVAGMLIVFVWSLGLPWAARWAVSLAAVLVTLLALFARVHIGAHWPSDTLGGVLFGTAIIALMQLAMRVSRSNPG